jgi:hypothetical protein
MDFAIRPNRSISRGFFVHTRNGVFRVFGVFRGPNLCVL